MINYKYDRNDIKAGILHIGVGNFHRAHQEYYTNLLLEDEDQHNWGICGLMLLPSDESVYRALLHQKGEYTLTVCAPNVDPVPYKIGSMVDLIWGAENPEAAFQKIANPDIKIITMTITEGGYNTDRTTGEFIMNAPLIEHDLTHPKDPQTVFGFIAEGLRRRMEINAPVTILSCDNLQHNGDTAKRSFTTYIQAYDSKLAAWIDKNVTFPNSMVDRITPSVKPQDIERLNSANGTNDQAPVYTEDFIQWVIEDKFIVGRPAWERVGVEFTDDVKSYENMKLSLLNASHMMLSFPASVAGFSKVDEAMADNRFVTLLKSFMNDDMTYYVPAPKNTDLDNYKAKLISRFGNKTISDQLSRICGDGISKLMVYIVPNLGKMIRDGRETIRMAFLVAAYYRYVCFSKDDKGRTIEVIEPWFSEADKQLTVADNPEAFLGISLFASSGISNDANFIKKYMFCVKSMAAEGIMETLNKIL